jgi:hypothetical protein
MTDIPQSMTETAKPTLKQKEAAAFVGVSEKTLYRYRLAGNLPYREIPDKTRPVIEYDREVLEKLRVELAERQAMSVKPAKEPVVPVLKITFALSPAEHQEIIEEAAKFDMKPNEYARQLMRDARMSRFQEAEQELREELKRAMSEIKRLRADVANGMEVVFESLGFTPENAKEWATENIR